MDQDDYDLLQFTSSVALGLAQVIAICAVEGSQTQYAILAGELVSASQYLELEYDEESILQEVRILIEGINRKLIGSQTDYDRDDRLRLFASTLELSHDYKQAVQELRSRLFELSTRPGALEDIIDNVRAYNIAHRKRFDAPEQRQTRKDLSKSEDIVEEQSAVYDVLRETLKCRCAVDPVEQPLEEPHSSRLLLRSFVTRDQDGNAQFDLLFSSRNPNLDASYRFWQDVRVTITRQSSARDRKFQHSKKKVQFAGGASTYARTDKSTNTHFTKPEMPTELYPGELCNYLNGNKNLRRCFVVNGNKIRPASSAIEHLERFVMPAPSISLANLLRCFHLTTRMRVTLGHVLARSVWHFYHSKWMSRIWTNETIHFVSEHNTGTPEPDLFATQPYLAVRFFEEPQTNARSSASNLAVHRFPEVLSLGIMLVEIGIGHVLPPLPQFGPIDSDAAKLNQDLTHALSFAKSKQPWKGFYAKTKDTGRMSKLEEQYREAVQNCLDPKLFRDLPKPSSADNNTFAEFVERRRSVLYNSVVDVLEKLMRNTGWLDDIHERESAKVQNQPMQEEAASANKLSRQKMRSFTEHEQVQTWFHRVYSLHQQLGLNLQWPRLQTRVRVAVIDTGVDDRSVFFQGSRGRRINKKLWKDFVDDSKKQEDLDGHGTSMVSLILKMAPQSDVCVIRVAKHRGELDEASDNVANAIKWAYTDLNANIVLMSFGYKDEQPAIRTAIYDAVRARDDQIIFIAAAANTGGGDRELFPARHDCVISVRATNVAGQFQAFNPARNERHAYDLGTIGVDVPCACLGNADGRATMAQDYRLLTGTSVAAAVTAGIGALLLGYVELNKCRKSYEVVRQRLASRQGMLAMLESLSKEVNKGHRYVTPWELEGSDDMRWAIIQTAVLRS